MTGVNKHRSLGHGKGSIFGVDTPPIDEGVAVEAVERPIPQASASAAISRVRFADRKNRQKLVMNQLIKPRARKSLFEADLHAATAAST